MELHIYYDKQVKDVYLMKRFVKIEFRNRYLSSHYLNLTVKDSAFSLGTNLELEKSEALDFNYTIQLKSGFNEIQNLWLLLGHLLTLIGVSIIFFCIVYRCLRRQEKQYTELLLKNEEKKRKLEYNRNQLKRKAREIIAAVRVQKIMEYIEKTKKKDLNEKEVEKIVDKFDQAEGIDHQDDYFIERKNTIIQSLMEQIAEISSESSEPSR